MGPLRGLPIVVSAVVLGATLVAVSPAQAAPPALTVTAPTSAWIGTTATVRGQVSPAGGALAVRVRRGSTWSTLATPAVGDDGRFAVGVPALSGAQTVQLSYGVAGETTTREAVITGAAAPVTVTLGGASRVADGASARLSVAWRTVDGRGVSGSAVLYGRRTTATTWTRRTTVRVVGGSGSVTVRPRADTVYRVATPATSSVRAGRSADRLLDNVPPGLVFRRPAGAPAPKVRLPAQKRATTAGAHVRIRRLTGREWRGMRGTTWHAGCPVGRSRLRVVETNYYAYDGYRRRGRMVVNASVATHVRGVFRDFHRAKVPIRSMYPVDRFGWSKRLRGGNDLRSMRAGNSSAFNCRGVVGRPGRLSPHSTGRSIDLNTWENPYRSGWGILPNRDWDSRRAPTAFVYRTSRSTVVRIMARHGFWWMGSAD